MKLMQKYFTKIILCSLLTLLPQATFAYSNADLAIVQKGASCPGGDLSGADLSGYNLAGRNFSGADFTEARLEDTNLD